MANDAAKSIPRKLDLLLRSPLKVPTPEQELGWLAGRVLRDDDELAEAFAHQLGFHRCLSSSTMWDLLGPQLVYHVQKVVIAPDPAQFASAAGAIVEESFAEVSGLEAHALFNEAKWGDFTPGVSMNNLASALKVEAARRVNRAVLTMFTRWDSRKYWSKEWRPAPREVDLRDAAQRRRERRERMGDRYVPPTVADVRRG